MITNSVIEYSLDDIQTAAKSFLKLIGNGAAAFHGNLGSGKTTFIKAICTELGCEEIASSPTFSLVNEYHFIDDSKESIPVFHIDLYRLNSLNEAFDIGIIEYLETTGFCFIEWPGIIDDILPPETLHVHVEILEKNHRKLIIFRE